MAGMTSQFSEREQVRAQEIPEAYSVSVRPEAPQLEAQYNGRSDRTTLTPNGNRFDAPAWTVD